MSKIESEFNLKSGERKDFYDMELAKTIWFLRERWFDEGVGIVAASLITDRRRIMATSTKNDDGRWNHAEHNAIEQLNPGERPLLLTTTLSPCVLESSSRAHKPCWEEIIDLGIGAVVVGHIDNKQAGDGSIYLNEGINFRITMSEVNKKISSNLYDLFSRRPLDKKEIGLAPFLV